MPRENGSSSTSPGSPVSRTRKWWEADTLEGHPDAPAELEHQDAQCQRDAPAALHDLVEQRIARAEVIGAIPAEAQFLEQEGAQPRQALQVVPVWIDAARQLVAPFANARQLVVDIDVRIALGGHQQCRPRQLESIVGALDQVDEIGVEVRGLVHGG